MEMSEFLDRIPEPTAPADETVELDVQKAVVESLAADKAVQDEQIGILRRENDALKSEVSTLRSEIDGLKARLAEVGDLLAKNAEGTGSNAIALIDRNAEVADRFEGETRDHVLEVIREARDAAEKAGRLRRAQLLEGVLVANEPIGSLAMRRVKLEKFFNENGNILTGPVIEELTRCGISYKNGEEYLLTTDILRRVY